MQAGVPLVPIVLRNAGQLMWRGEVVVHPGTLQVAVLAPISTAGWRVEDVGDHVAEVRRRYEATLERWPGDGRPAMSSDPARDRSESHQPAPTG
jgi:1-acyl-sn-glycerol-3-phosphate acyltransferase